MSTVHGNLSHAMRDNYNEHGVDEYYRKVAATYRNPFYPGIKKVVWTFMNRWWEAEGRDLFAGEGQADEGKESRELRVLDMAAGSGEATLCLLEWAQPGKPGSSSQLASISALDSGSSSAPDPLAALRGITSPVPNGMGNRPVFIPPNVRHAGANAGSRVNNGRSVFGSMDPPTLPKGFGIDVVATDPYTSPAFTARTARPCHPLSFEDLANGALPPDNSLPTNGEPLWDMIICSFALHLVTSPSELFSLLFELSNKARWMVIIAPHKKPEIKETWGWSRYDIASWSAAGEAKLYGGGKGTDEDEETELEIVRDK